MLAASQTATSGSDPNAWNAYYAQYYAQLAAAGGVPNAASANGTSAGDDSNAAGAQDYTSEWIAYYRAYGMQKEADQIEQMAKARKSTGGPPDHSKSQSTPAPSTQTVAYPGFNYSSYTQQK